MSSDPPTLPHKSTKRKRNEPALDPDEDSNAIKKSKKSTSKHDGTLETEKKPKKVRKQSDANPTADNVNEVIEVDAIPLQGKVTKKSKNKTGFPDPSKDATLSAPAQKAISYAFLQFRHPSRWKFNKARQNWLVRNMWSIETIPDTYFPLLCKYLTNVQGGTRKKLIAKCNSLTTTADVDSAETSQVPTQDGTTTEGAANTNIVQVARAITLLAALVVHNTSETNPSHASIIQ